MGGLLRETSFQIDFTACLAITETSISRLVVKAALSEKLYSKLLACTD